MKRKGFTLIELLAVIVILAIIALIATPIVLDIIEDSKNSSIKRSIELYADAVENSVAKAQLNGSVVPSGKYTTTDGKTLTQGNTTIKVDYDGAKTVCDVVISNKGNIYLENCSVNDKTVEYTYGDVIYYNGKIVYFDVATGKACDNYTEENSNTGYNGIGGTGKQNGCLKFYAFNDFGSDKVNLILDHNTTAKVAWISKDDYISAGGEDLSAVVSCQYGGLCATTEFGPITSLTQLKNDTALWQGTETPENYIMDQVGQTSNANYVIKYKDEGYKARLITPNEVATIVENTSFDEKTDIDTFYFDTNTSTASPTCKEGNITGCKYGWLYDRTAPICTTYGCSNNSDVSIPGYWTSTSRADNANNAWNVNYYGNVYYVNITSSSSYGVRPVIEVLKSNLS